MASCLMPSGVHSQARPIPRRERALSRRWYATADSFVGKRDGNRGKPWKAVENGEDSCLGGWFCHSHRLFYITYLPTLAAAVQGLPLSQRHLWRLKVSSPKARQVHDLALCATRIHVESTLLKSHNSSNPRKPKTSIARRLALGPILLPPPQRVWFLEGQQWSSGIIDCALRLVGSNSIGTREIAQIAQ